MIHIESVSGHTSRTYWLEVKKGTWNSISSALTWCAFFIFLWFLLPAISSGETVAAGERLTLQRAIDAALKNQPSILAGIYAVRAGEARIGQAQSNYYPQINASGAYTRTSPASTTTGQTSTINAFNQYVSSVGLNQMIFDFGKTPTQVNIDKLNTESSRFDLSNIRDIVVLNVKQAYYNVLQAERNKDVAIESVKQFQQHLEQAQGFFAVGTSAKFDVTKAEVDLSNAKLNLIKAENQVRLNKVALNSAMGISGGPDYSLENNLFFVKYGLPFEEAITKAYDQRSDLLSLIKRKEAAKASIALARKGYTPVLTGSANYYYTGIGFPLDNGWNYGMNLSIPIFSGFLTTYQVAEARENYNSLNANEQSLRLDIYSQTQQGYLNLRQAEESLGTTELTVRQAKENVELATGRYRAGVGSPLEVTDALVSLNNAEVAYTQSLTDYKNAQAAIEKAIGVR